MRKSPLFPIFLIVLVDVFGFTLVIPLLAIYAEHFAASPLQATLLVSTYAACQLISGPILGRISDRVGRKPVLLVSQIGTCIGFLVMAEAHALWMLYLARIIDGATAGNLSIAQAYISDHTTKDNRTKSFAIIGIAFGTGFFLGPFVTGALAAYDLRAPIYLAAALSLTSILCTMTLLQEDRPAGLLPAASGAAKPGATSERAAPPSKRYGHPLSALFSTLKRPIVGGILLQFFFYIVSFGTFTSGFALFAERRFTWHGSPFGPREIGYFFAYGGFLGILIQGGLVGRLVKKYGDAGLVRSAFATLVVAYILLGIVPDSIPMLLGVATLSSFGNGILRPALTSLLTQSAGAGEQGTILGVNQSGNAIAQILAPALGGFLIERGLTGPWAWVGAAAALAGFLLAPLGTARAGTQAEAAADPSEAASPSPDA